MTMHATRLTIDASRLRNQVSDLLGYVHPLDASDVRHLPIVDICGDRVEICDGYHRIAGLIAGGAETIDCVTCDVPRWLSYAADNGQQTMHRFAIQRIYAALSR